MNITKEFAKFDKQFRRSATKVSNKSHEYESSRSHHSKNSDSDISVDLSDEERTQAIDHRLYKTQELGGFGPRKAITQIVAKPIICQNFVKQRSQLFGGKKDHKIINSFTPQKQEMEPTENISEEVQDFLMLRTLTPKISSQYNWQYSRQSTEKVQGKQLIQEMSPQQISSYELETSTFDVQDKPEEPKIEPNELLPVYCDTNSVTTLLQTGISCRKFHYSQPKAQFCQLKLSKNKKKIIWVYEKNKIGMCSITEIKAFLYGAISSNFQQYKKRILQQIQAGEQQEFYSWQCISLYLKDRTLDFVIPDEEQLFSLISFLDNKNQNLPQKIVKQKLKTFKLMKIKMKISYCALVKGMTVVELFLNTFLKRIMESEANHKPFSFNLDDDIPLRNAQQIQMFNSAKSVNHNMVDDCLLRRPQIESQVTEATICPFKRLKPQKIVKMRKQQSPKIRKFNLPEIENKFKIMKKIEFYKMQRKEILRLLSFNLKVDVQKAMYLPAKSDICFQFYLSEDILLGKKVGDIQRQLRCQSIQKMTKINSQQKQFKIQNLEAIKKRGRSMEKAFNRSQSLSQMLRSVFCGLNSTKKITEAEEASPMQRKKLRALSKQKFMKEDIRNNTIKLKQTLNLKAKGVFIDNVEKTQTPNQKKIKKILHEKSNEKYQTFVGQIYFKKLAQSEQKVNIHRIEKGQKIMKQQELIMQHLQNEQLYFNPAYDKLQKIKMFKELDSFK